MASAMRVFIVMTASANALQTANKIAWTDTAGHKQKENMTGNVCWMLTDVGSLINCDDLCEGYSMQCDETSMVLNPTEFHDAIEKAAGCNTMCEYFYYSNYYDNFPGILGGFQPPISCDNFKAESPKKPTCKGMAKENFQRLCACSSSDSTVTCPIKKEAACSIVEDPHIASFDQAQVSLIATVHNEVSGDQWLVKTGQVWIQARFAKVNTVPQDKLFMSAIAVGGPSMKGSTIVIPSLGHDITWNGQPVLQNQTSSFEVRTESYSVKANRSEHSFLATDLSKESPGVEIELSFGVSLILNRLYDHVNAVIKMKQRMDAQEGLCGNFNGIGADDSLELASNRMSTAVPDEQSLFS